MGNWLLSKICTAASPHLPSRFFSSALVSRGDKCHKGQAMYISTLSQYNENGADCAISIVSSSDSARKSLLNFFSGHHFKFIFSESFYQAIDAICGYKAKLFIAVVDTSIAGNECEEISREIRSIDHSLPILHYTALSATRRTLSINPLLFDGHISDPLDRENVASTLERAVLRRQAACRFLGLNFNHVMCDDFSKAGEPETSSPPENSHR